MGKAIQLHLMGVAGAVASLFASLFIVGLLSGCGSSSSSAGESSNDHAELRPVNTTFSRVGLDVDPEGLRTSGDLGATIDSAFNITFHNPYFENHANPYNFTFASGLRGGSTGNDAADLVTFIQPPVNKTIHILAPYATRNVQNVFWFNSDNPGVYGFGEAGYLLNPGKSVWPVSGVDYYKGQAFQYVVDSNSALSGYGGYALLTTEANATLDYAAHTLVINIESGASGRWITQNSSIYGLNGQLAGTSLKLPDLDLTEQYLSFQLPPSKKTASAWAFPTWIPLISLDRRHKSWRGWSNIRAWFLISVLQR